MRIWHVNAARHAPRVDGISCAVDRLADGQRAHGHLVTVQRCEPGRHETPRAVALDVAAQLVRCGAPDIVHFHSVFRPAHTALGRLLEGRVPYVVSPHSALAGTGLARDRRRKAAYLRTVERRFLRRAGAVACLTPVERTDVERQLAGGRCGVLEVVPNAVGEEALDAPRWQRQAVSRRVVTLARFDIRQKGLDYLAEVALHCPDIDFVVHGQQDHNEPHRTEQLRAWAPDNFRLEDPVFGADKWEVLSGASLYVQPSRWEGISTALLDAMAVGVPCAVSPYVASTLPWDDGRLGLVLHPDPFTAGAQIRDALTAPDRLAGWSEASAGFVRTALDPSTVAQRQLDLYEAVLSG